MPAQEPAGGLTFDRCPPNRASPHGQAQVAGAVWGSRHGRDALRRVCGCNTRARDPQSDSAPDPEKPADGLRAEAPQDATAAQPKRRSEAETLRQAATP